MSIEEPIAQEGADWIAEMVTEELGGFIPSELVDLIMELEVAIRAEAGDPEMSHGAMADRVLPKLAEEGLPVDQTGGITKPVVVEILHWEDEFLGMAGRPRTIRPT